jgi:hypothetical protein
MRTLSSIIFALLTVSLISCARTPSPDRYPAGTKITLTMRENPHEQYQLGPRSSQLFLDMLTNQPVHSEIGQMPARPVGRFTVADVDYLWHGNGVIRGKDRDERLWHGPFLQRLIIEVMRLEGLKSRDSLQHILDALEKDATVESTPLQGPGQYPNGANDALHPAKLTVGDTNDWRVFEPQSRKP